MKIIHLLTGIGLVSLLAGCATARLTFDPVGPDPHGIESTASGGELLVFSSLVGRSEGNDPTWHQHSSYYIYDMDGKLVNHVHNATGHYARAPLSVELPAGNYLVKAKASDYFWVKVPVTIERGRTTEVHLDDNWNPGETSDRDLVRMPNGNLVGWRAESAKGLGSGQ
jgi:hypothetical protein